LNTRSYVPTTFEGSSSISHLDEAAYPPGAPSSLMTPVLAKQEVIHNVRSLSHPHQADYGNDSPAGLGSNALDPIVRQHDSSEDY
jgi:hypothetical protein